MPHFKTSSDYQLKQFQIDEKSKYIYGVGRSMELIIPIQQSSIRSIVNLNETEATKHETQI